MSVDTQTVETKDAVAAIIVYQEWKLDTRSDCISIWFKKKFNSLSFFTVMLKGEDSHKEMMIAWAILSPLPV